MVLFPMTEVKGCAPPNSLRIRSVNLSPLLRGTVPTCRDRGLTFPTIKVAGCIVSLSLREKAPHPPPIGIEVFRALLFSKSR